MLTRKIGVLKHHDQSPSVQQRFFAHTKTLVIAFQEAGIPFDEDSHEVVIIDARYIFFGVHAWLVMTFNYLILWVRVRVKVLGSVNSNHNHNPKHIYNPNPNPTLTLILTLTLNLLLP